MKLVSVLTLHPFRARPPLTFAGISCYLSAMRWMQADGTNLLVLCPERRGPRSPELALTPLSPFGTLESPAQQRLLRTQITASLVPGWLSNFQSVTAVVATADDVCYSSWQVCRPRFRRAHSFHPARTLRPANTHPAAAFAPAYLISLYMSRRFLSAQQAASRMFPC